MHPLAWDSGLAEAFQGLRWAPLTSVFVLLSAWWVKSLVLCSLGAAGDALRRRPPLTALAAAGAFAAAALLTDLVKALAERPRPAGDVLVVVPGSYSFPSGHAATAFAAATVVALLHPRLRWPALGLAALVALSRVYLGVHYPLDVLAGALLGAVVGWAATRAVVRASRARGQTAG